MSAHPDYLLVIHGFAARNEDELNFQRGEYIEVIEDDAEFGDKWYIGRNLNTGATGLFPSVFTTSVAGLPPGFVAAPPLDEDRGSEDVSLSSPAPSSYSARGSAPPAESMGALSIQNKRASLIAPVDPGMNGSASTFGGAGRKEEAVSNGNMTGSNGNMNAYTGSMNSGQVNGGLEMGSPGPNSYSPNETLHESSNGANGTTGSNGSISPNGTDLTNGYAPKYSNGSTHSNHKPGLTVRTNGSASTTAMIDDIDAALSEMQSPQSTEGFSNSPMSPELRSGELRSPPLSQQPQPPQQSPAPRPRPETVLQWTPADVHAYFQSLGFAAAVASKFEEHQITGRILLQLDRDTLKELEITSFGTRFEIDKEVKWLQSTSTPQLGSPVDSQSHSGSLPSLHSQATVTSASAPSPGPHTPTQAPWVRWQSPQTQPTAVSTLPTGQQPTSLVSLPKRPVQTAYGGVYSPPKVPMGPPSTNTLLPYQQQQQNQAQSSLDAKQRNVAAAAAQTAHHRRASSAASKFSSQRSVVDWESGLEPALPETASIQSPIHSPTHSRSPSKTISQTHGHSRSLSRNSMVLSGSGSLGMAAPGSPGSPRMPYRASHARSLSDLALNSGAATPVPGPEVKAHRRHSSILSGFSVLHTPKSAKRAERESKEITDFSEPGTPNAGVSKEVKLPKDIKESPKKRNSGGAFKGLRSASSQVLRPHLVKQKTSAFQEGIQQTTAEEAGQRAEHAGWMHKRGGSGPGMWKSRYFTLNGTRLSYFGTFKDTKERGLIDITGHRVVPIENNEDKLVSLYAASVGAGRYCFKLVPPAPGYKKGVAFTAPKTHYFAVDSQEELWNWTSALMKATIERDESQPAISTCATPVVSLAKAQEMMAERMAREANNA